MIRGASGREALRTWLERAARKADRAMVLEEAILAGRFWRYAGRRLLAFALVRASNVVVHLVELMVLFEIFSAKPFVASIALQNVTLVVDAAWWGALESLRQRLRRLGPTSEGAALVSRWLTVATALGLVAIGAPIALWSFGKREDPLLHAYALACGVRLAADVVLRTYHAGVFAHGRVYRPIWSVVTTPFVVVGTTLVLWDRIGGWSFVVGLLAATVLSRALLFVYTRRAYRRSRAPSPRLRLRVSGLGTLVDRDVILASIANLSTRLGGVVLLAALLPSLTINDGLDDEPRIEPFAFGLHLGAPFLLVASQWAFVFYHDWKRVEDHGATHLARVMGRKLTSCGVVLGIVCSLASSALVLAFVPWQRSWPTLVALSLATVGMAIWTSHQLRHFAHGDHLRQAISAGMIVVVVGSALAIDALDVVSFYFALAAGPWIAIGMASILERLLRRETFGIVSSTSAFVDAASRAKGSIVVWAGTVERRGGLIAEHIAKRVGPRGAVLQRRHRIVWFERANVTTRGDWIALGGGLMRTLERHEIVAEHAETELLRLGVVHAAKPSVDDTLERIHAEHFPEGFVVRLDTPPPSRFTALSPATRQAIWRDALRFQTGARGRSGWFVTCRARSGAPDIIFVAPRPVEIEAAAAWRDLLADGALRLTSPRRDRRTA